MFHLFQKKRATIAKQKPSPTVIPGLGFFQTIVNGPDYNFFFKNARKLVPATFTLEDDSEFQCVLDSASPLSITIISAFSGDPLFYLSGSSNMGPFKGYYDPTKRKGAITTESCKRDRIMIMRRTD